MRPPLPAATLTALFFTTTFTAPANAQETVLGDRRAAAEASPDDYGAQRAYGEALLRAARYPEARRQMERAARLERTRLDAHYDVARVEFAAGDTRRARQACVALRRRDRDAALTKVCEARAFLAENRSGRAFSQIEDALEADPTSALAWVAMGDARRLRGQLDEAKAAYLKAVDLAPADPAPWIGLGRLEAAARRNEHAVGAYRRAVERDPGDPTIQYELARRLPAGSDERRRLLVEAVAGRPGWPEAQVALGEALLAHGQPGEAEVAFRAALQESDRLAPAHLGVGQARGRQDDLDGAEAAIRRALELVPNFVEAKIALARVLADKGETERALALYREAADLDPRDVRPLVEAARLALAQDRDVTAAGYVTRAAGLAEDHALVLEAMGDLARHRGQPDEARDFYRRALAASEGADQLDRDRVQASLTSVR